jgi:ABC-type lipoprotein export system ATPase subunit
MSLLELRGVSKSHSRGSRRIEILREVSLEIEVGEFVAVWGLRRSGRSTLLAVAAGIDRPDAGTVVFAGQDLSARGIAGLGNGIGYCNYLTGAPGRRKVIDNVRAGLLARGMPVPTTHSQAHKALERVGADQCGELALGDLDAAEVVRVAIATALVLQPRLLVIDEPTKGVDLLDRDNLILLLRSLADEGIAVLVSDGDGSGLADADRTLSLAAGELHGKTTPQTGSVVSLQRATERNTAA